MGSWKGRGNQYIQFVRVLYCKLLTNGKQLPAFPLEAVPGTKPRPQRWEARVLPLCHRGPLVVVVVAAVVVVVVVRVCNSRTGLSNFLNDVNKSLMSKDQSISLN